MSDWTNWCTGYYTRAFCKEKIAELRSDPKIADVKYGSKVCDCGVWYYRIRIREWN